MKNIAKCLISFMLACTLGGCATQHVTSIGPRWALKAKCELNGKTTNFYVDAEAETKCGGVLEMTLLEGGQ